MIYVLLIGILVMCGWIMITLNEIDRTNQNGRNDIRERIHNVHLRIDQISEKIEEKTDYLIDEIAPTNEMAKELKQFRELREKGVDAFYGDKEND